MSVLLYLLACLTPPVDAPVIDPYRPPPCVWCAGNRGITYGTAPGTSVRSVTAGVVSYAGAVAGERYVVVALGDGRRLTYGNLSHVDVTAGDWVTAGQRLGTSTHRLHLGLRRGDVYENPDTLFRSRSRARLLRFDGRRRPPSASIPCGLTPVGSMTIKPSRLPPAVA